MTQLFRHHLMSNSGCPCDMSQAKTWFLKIFLLEMQAYVTCLSPWTFVLSLLRSSCQKSVVVTVFADPTLFTVT